MWKANMAPVSRRPLWRAKPLNCAKYLVSWDFHKRFNGLYQGSTEENFPKAALLLERQPTNLSLKHEEGTSPSLLLLFSLLFLLCSQGPWEVRCRWIALHSCSSRIPQVLPQHRALSTGPSDTGGRVVSDWGAAFRILRHFTDPPPPLSPLSDSSMLSQVVTI